MWGIMEALVQPFGGLGRLFIQLTGYLGGLLQLLLDCIYWIVLAPVLKKKWTSFRETVRHIVFAGVNSLPILFLIVFLVGMILAYNSAYQLKKVGVINLVPAIVGVAMTREIGPLLTAIVVASRVGASYTAELGTMKVSEEIPLETLAINPVRYLVAPRLVAMLILFPMLVTLANCVGMAGGLLVGSLNLGLGVQSYWITTFDFLVPRDLAVGWIKSFFFATIIVLVSCREGMAVTGGAAGVGKATTSSVVNAVVLVIASNLVFALLFFMME